MNEIYYIYKGTRFNGILNRIDDSFSYAKEMIECELEQGLSSENLTEKYLKKMEYIESGNEDYDISVWNTFMFGLCFLEKRNFPV